MMVCFVQYVPCVEDSVLGIVVDSKADVRAFYCVVLVFRCRRPFDYDLFGVCVWGLEFSGGH